MSPPLKRCECKICRASQQGRRPAAGARLKNMVTEESSLVAAPANGHPFVMTKAVVVGKDSHPAAGPAVEKARALVDGLMKIAPFRDEDRLEILRTLRPLLEACGVEVELVHPEGATPPAPPKGTTAAKSAVPASITDLVKSEVRKAVQDMTADLGSLATALQATASVRPPPPQIRPPPPSVIWGSDLGASTTKAATTARKAAIESELRSLPTKHCDDLSKQITERKRLQRELEALNRGPQAQR